MHKMIPLAVLHCAAMSFAMTEHEASFQLYKQRFHKQYSAAEERQRFAAFSASLERVAASGNPSHGLTKFSDMTPEEFKRIYATRGKGGALADNAQRWNGQCTSCARFPELKDVEVTDINAFDWRTKGAVTPVKNQGSCGSCWSFATTGDIEGTWFLAGNTLTSLSEQQLVSCDHTSSGCNGGMQEYAFTWIVRNGGVAAEADYPYVSGSGSHHACETGHKSVANITKYYQVSGGTPSGPTNESNIVEQLVKAGPITTSIDSTPMQDYASGIDNPHNCQAKWNSLDHAVLFVGFGTENGVDYWVIKNSWAKDWGEEGYYRIVRGENKCGIALDAIHSVV